MALDTGREAVIQRKSRLLLCSSMTVLAFVVGVLLSGCTPVQAPDSHPRATSQAQALEILAACLTEHGWDVSVSGDALMSGDIPNEQIAAYSKDSDECGENLTPDLSEFDDKQWHELYDITMQNVDCLRNQGFEFDDVPSFQTFRGLVGKWSPFLELMQSGQMSPDKVNHWNELCPQPQYWG